MRIKKHLIHDKAGWLGQIIHSIHDGVLVIDREGIVQLINPEYTRITGVKEEEIIGEKLRDVRPGAQLIDVMEKNEKISGVYRKEGKQEYIVDMAPIMEDHEIIGAVSICKSMNEVNHLTKELKDKQKLVEQLEGKVDSLYHAKHTFNDIIGAHGDLKEIIRNAEKMAETDLPILITGESGTGKELFAQSIHNASDRYMNPFVPVNCAAIPSHLMESELFGYVDGAFTGSKKGGKLGLFELAGSGTIFLDEIGELPFELQAKLLRVLEEKKVRRIGEGKERSIQARIISATNQSMKNLINNGLFREDLFYRLNVLQIHIPPLRERKNDLFHLIHSLVKESPLRPVGKQFQIDEQALNMLMDYPWPGNIRELKNTLINAICMSDGTTLTIEDFPDTIPRHSVEYHTITPHNLSLKSVVENAEKSHVRTVLKKYRQAGNPKQEAARELGISLASLYNKIKKHNL